MAQLVFAKRSKTLELCHFTKSEIASRIALTRRNCVLVLREIYSFDH